MANATFGVNIIPKNNTVTLGSDVSPWNIASPNLTGTPIAPTAAAGTNSTQVATTAFVNAALPSDMTGATTQVAGTHGLVPAPTINDTAKYLKGDGTWSTVPGAAPMTGATSSAAGTAGIVPAPSIGDNTNFLRGDGTWTLPSGARIFVAVLDTVTNTSGAYSHATTISGVTADLKAIQIECSNPEIFKDTINIVTDTDSVTLTCASVEGTSTVKVSLLVFGDLNPLSSAEYSALNTRITGITSYMPTLAIAIPTAGSSVSYNMEGITSDSVVLRWNFSESPENAPPCNLTCVTSNGQFTITNNLGVTNETVQPLFSIPSKKIATLYVES